MSHLGKNKYSKQVAINKYVSLTTLKIVEQQISLLLIWIS
jgi:hypothetical protein